jgi:hypothetical protein
MIGSIQQSALSIQPLGHSGYTSKASPVIERCFIRAHSRDSRLSFLIYEAILLSGELEL